MTQSTSQVPTESRERNGWNTSLHRRLQKTRRDGADVAWRGRSFQTRAGETRKAPS